MSIPAASADPATGPRPTGPVRRAARRVALAVVLVAWTLPTLAVVVASLRPRAAGGGGAWWSADRGWTLGRYREALGPDGGAMWDGVLDTLVIAVPATVLPVALGAAAAFALVRARVATAVRALVVLAGLVVAPAALALVSLAPAYAGGAELGGVTLVPDLDLIGRPVGTWLAHTAFSLPFVVVLLVPALAAVPPSVLDTARLDGAGELRVLVSVALPLALPAVAAVATLQLLWVWNDLLVALVLLGGPDAGTVPLTVRLVDLVATRGQELGLVSAGAVVTAVVPVVVHLVLRHRLADRLVDLEPVD